MPHRNVYARLGPSKIDGVGVFAIRNIRKGIDIFPDLNDKIIWVEKSKIRHLRGEIRRLYEYYCIRKIDKYGAPESFNKINVSWYLNHSSRPNAYADQDYRVFAKRDIKRGEEITLDYTTFMNVKIPMDWT